MGVEISVDLPLPGIHYDDKRKSIAESCSYDSEMENMELYENIIDLLDFEDVFEYFDEAENLVEQAVLEGVSWSTGIVGRSLVVESV